MSVKSRSELGTLIQTALADNTAYDITAEELRGVLKDTLDSCYRTMLINTQTDDYTPLLSDANRTLILMDKDSTIVNLTIPSDSSVGFQIGDRLRVSQVNHGQVTFVEDTGVTLLLPDGMLGKLKGKGCSVQIIKIAANKWQIFTGLDEVE